MMQQKPRRSQGFYRIILISILKMFMLGPHLSGAEHWVYLTAMLSTQVYKTRPFS